MKRDWDAIREVLAQVESLSDGERYGFGYGLGSEHSVEQAAAANQAILLWKAGFIEAVDVSTLAGPAIQAPELTWAGHDLLDILRSRPLWERIKATAQEKGVELTFDAVKALGKQALDYVLQS